MKQIKERMPWLSLAFNSLYAIGNGLLGFYAGSWWFVTVAVYYGLLAVARFVVLRIARKGKIDGAYVRRIAGILLVALSFCLIGVNILSALKDRGTVFHNVIMIAIAAYTFSKITVAIYGLCRAQKRADPIYRTLRSISLADGVVSVYALQRSMLVSFPGMTPGDIQLFNILTGTGVWIFLLTLGILLIGGRYVDMPKSKIVKAGQAVGEAAAKGYKAVENGVVTGYKAVEKGVVSGYEKMEDKFVETFLTKEGETVEEAKKRLKEK